MLELVLNACVTDTNEMGIEQLDELGKIRQRAREPVDLVDHHDVDLAGPDLGEELLQGWSFQRGAGEAAVIIVVGNEPPALLRLALDIGLTGLALGVERVEGRGRGYARSTCGCRWRSASNHRSISTPWALPDRQGKRPSKG